MKTLYIYLYMGEIPSIWELRILVKGANEDRHEKINSYNWTSLHCNITICTLWPHGPLLEQCQNHSYRPVPSEDLASCPPWLPTGWPRRREGLYQRKSKTSHSVSIITYTSMLLAFRLEMRSCVHSPGLPPAASTRVSDQSTACIKLNSDQTIYWNS